MMRRWRLHLARLALGLPLAAAALPPGLGLPPRPGPVATPAQVALGRQLFMDRSLSVNGTMSCAMCHLPEQGFASQASRLAVGLEGRSLRRNAPGLLNVAWQSALFHDGRETALETQAWGPLLHPDEMGNPSAGHLLARVRANPAYRGRFERAFGRRASMDTLGAALAAYQRTLVAGGSRFDAWRYGGQTDALTPLEQAGWRLFSGRAGCTACHTAGKRHALFSDGRFHVTGAGLAAAELSIDVPLAPGVQVQIDAAMLQPYDTPRAPDLGRWEISLRPEDRRAFKTPSLRQVAHTAPYMHDGSLPDLAAVIDFYARGGGAVEGRSPLLRPLDLSAEDRRALVAFLQALDSPQAEVLARRARQP